jgi:cell division protein FtsN
VQEHLKVRLTGAVILVCIVVALVPELFRGRPPIVADHGSSGVEGLPLRSVTIDLRDGPSVQAPGQALLPQPPPASTPATAPVVTPPADPAAATPLATSPATSPVTAPVAAPVAAPAAATPATNASSPPSAPPSAPVTSAASAGWIVQVGTFSRRDFADRMAAQVRAKGFAVQVAGPDDRGLYRVRSAAMATRPAAQALLQRMQARGLKPIVNGAP